MLFAAAAVDDVVSCAELPYARTSSIICLMTLASLLGLFDEELESAEAEVEVEFAAVELLDCAKDMASCALILPS